MAQSRWWIENGVEQQMANKRGQQMVNEMELQFGGMTQMTSMSRMMKRGLE